MVTIFLKRLMLTAVFICVSAQIAPAKDIFIATTGSDANPGTRSKPLASVQAAQVAVRACIKVGLKEAVNVIFAPGTYFLAEPLALTATDSGTAQCPITWQAVKDDTATLSGGTPITGTWKQSGKNNIWSVDVPGVKKGWNFRQLFVEGTRATRARFPNASEKNPFLYATGGGIDHVRIAPKLVKASWAAPDAQINVVAQWKFFNQWNTVTGVDLKSGRIDIADSERHGKIIKGNWFWIEGVKEELDEPGEWYLDQAKARLYYMPKPGINPNTLKIVASRLNVIVYAKGDVEKKTHVQNVHFKGLQFRHTTFTLGHIEARVHTDAAIRLENATHCRIENCHFENIGGYALWLHLDSQRNIFDRNSVLHSGGGGVLLTGSRLSYMDDTKLFTPGKVAATVAPILNRITRNTVKHCGKIRYYGGGVHLDSRPASMAMAPGNYIAHNYFADLSRNGVFAFRNQGGNIVEYNHIHDAMQTIIDGACIHFATMNHLNAPNYILNNWLYDIWGYNQKPDGQPTRHLANGVFLDWDSSNMIVKDNY
ncbi:MAG: right-handed parallel beta-helix repeat-containing protein, partial [Phycisphaerae bacterium]|nr:right-handed parallel beta-helix repeat-containing protein [Phycisphaerae bacterium]